MIYDSLVEYLTLVAGIVSPLMLILGFGYQYFIKPWEKRKAKEAEKAQQERLAQDKEYQDKMLEIARRQIEPIHAVLEEIKEITLDSEYDRKHLNEVTKQNSKRIEKAEDKLDDHAERLIVLEARSDSGSQEVIYKEKYGNIKETK